MIKIFQLFLPGIKSFKSIKKEIDNTSISRERFIDFIKVLGLLMIIVNTNFLIRFGDSYGEYLIFNLSFSDPLKATYSWFTVGMALFFFSVGFTNKIAWYANVGRDGSQWKFLTDRVNALLGPAIVWIFVITLSLNIYSRFANIPLFFTSQDDGIVPLTEFIMWPLWLVSIYLVVVIFCPVTLFLHKTNPYLTLFGLIFATVAVDTFEFSIAFSYLKLINYLLFWLAIHQLGYFFADGQIFSIKLSFFTTIFIICFGYLFYINNTSEEFMSLSSYRLIMSSNEDPPTIYYLIASLGLSSGLLILRKPIEKFLENKIIWNIFSFIHANIFTLFLWHIFILFYLYIFNLPNNIYVIALLIFGVLFGDYERSVFKLSPNIIRRVNPLQPWPTPIKAKLSYSNFSLAWISSLLVLIGIFQITLGGIGLSGFFTLRELYFISSNTFEALIKVGTGLLLLNLTIRRVDLKSKILIIAAGLQLIVLLSRNTLFNEITQFELYFSSVLIIYFLYIAFINRNYKSLNSV